MTLDVLLTVVGALGALVAALSARLRLLPVSEPLLALIVGMLLGPAVLGFLPLARLEENHELMHESARLLLAISVMGVALRYPVRAVRRILAPVTLLLLVALPVMALMTTFMAMTLLGVPFAVAFLLGSAVAPTDPVLASSVVTGEAAERSLPALDRQVLSIESGANDGLALPLVLLALAVAGPLTGPDVAAEMAWQILGAAAVGVVVGWAGGQALRLGDEYGATSPGPMLLFTVVLALAVMGVSGLLQVDGVLAVFVAGLAFNYVSTVHERTAEVTIDEAVNRFVLLPVFAALGASVPWHEWAVLGWAGVGLALGVLFLRRLPVILLLRRPLKLGLPDAVYLGWFGPVGVSALFYLTLETERLNMPPEVLAAGTLILVTSTIAHGITSSPGRMLYRRATESG